MHFIFHLPPMEGPLGMRATPEGLEMLRKIDDDNFRSALISGGPGSGKTTVSIYRLRRLTKQNVNVHLVTFQNMLVVAIRGMLAVLQVSPDRVSTFHQWYYQVTKNYFDIDNPPTANQMIDQLQRSPLAHQKLDEILIDEGQDLPLCIYETIPQYATRCFVGADNAQQVHKRHGAQKEQIEHILRENFSEYKPIGLVRNFRNTYETYRFARQFIPQTNRIVQAEVTLERLLRENRHGPKPIVVSYRDPSQRDEHLRITLNNADGNVAILCPLGPYPKNYNHSGESVDEIHQIITKMGIDASKYRSGESVPDGLEQYVVTTFKSAKGMEFDVVVIPRINFFRQIPEEWYVACTRALRRLIIYRDLGDPQCDPIARFASDTYEAQSLDAVATTDDNQPF